LPLILACQDDNNKMSDGTVPAESKGRPSLKSKTLNLFQQHHKIGTISVNADGAGQLQSIINKFKINNDFLENATAFL
jgi:hypothetical protein